MDQLIKDNNYVGRGCNLPLKNLEFLRSEYPDLFIKITEGVYRIQLIGIHGFSEEDIINRLAERNEQDRIETEKSQNVWNQIQNREGK